MMPMVKTDNRSGVVWLTLSQGQRRNPLSTEMLTALSDCLNDAYNDEAARVIVIAAEGPVFSAGHDLSEMARRESETQDEWRARVLAILELCAEMMQGIVHAPKPLLPVFKALPRLRAASWCRPVISRLHLVMRSFVRRASTWVLSAQRLWSVSAEICRESMRWRWHSRVRCSMQPLLNPLA